MRRGSIDVLDRSMHDGPMSHGTGRHILKTLDELWVEALSFAAIVESTFATSVTVFCNQRPELAADVKAREREIDRKEVAIEAECLRVLALYEPVASDFRRVLTVLRVNRDLERIGDLAARIAKRARKLALSAAPVAIPEALEELAVAATQALGGALDSLAKCDATIGRSVISEDHHLSEYRRAVRGELKGAIRRDVARLDDWLYLMDIARHLERVGDHAKGIAEAVVYLKEGKIVRHVPGSVQP